MRTLQSGVGIGEPDSALHRLKTWITSGVPVRAARNAPPGLRCNPPPTTTNRKTKRQIANEICLTCLRTIFLPSGSDIGQTVVGLTRDRLPDNFSLRARGVLLS